MMGHWWSRTMVGPWTLGQLGPSHRCHCAPFISSKSLASRLNSHRLQISLILVSTLILFTCKASDECRFIVLAQLTNNVVRANLMLFTIELEPTSTSSTKHV
eukprot:9358588-Pyramimonas_sp.AAC.1